MAMCDGFEGWVHVVRFIVSFGHRSLAVIGLPVGREFRVTPLGLCFVGWGRGSRPLAWADIGPPHSGFRNFCVSFVFFACRRSFDAIVRVRSCLLCVVFAACQCLPFHHSIPHVSFIDFDSVAFA